MSNIDYDSDQKTIQEIIHLYEKKLLNLNPGFQRSSVWSKSDRAHLIDSIVKNYPLPSVFFYRREHDGHIIYDVIDGKQRIESILMFTGMMRGQEFSAKMQLPESEKVDNVTWAIMKERRLQPMINGYKIQVIEVRGDLADIIDLFVRINSTGKALTSAEKRNAQYNESEFLKKAWSLAHKYEDYFIGSGIVSTTQCARMKHVELICELIVAANRQDVSDKKLALDRVMDPKSIPSAKLVKAVAQADAGLKRIKTMFPKLKETRFRNLSDFYTLAVLIQKFEREGLVLSDSSRNELAWDILVMLSNGVDKLSLQQKKQGDAISMDADKEIFRSYIATVREGTDKEAQRARRQKMLCDLLESLFQKKDAARGFSAEQRRLLWNSTRDKSCTLCHEPLTWNNFTIDHIDPYSKGGRTELDNAEIMCGPCNSGKGNRTRHSSNGSTQRAGVSKRKTASKSPRASAATRRRS